MSLTAISPIDGRYSNKTETLAQFTSELALNRYRLSIEVQWLIAMGNSPEIKEVPPLSTEASTYLGKLVSEFDHQAAQEIKDIEATTNHDVKAVEYYLKQHMSTHSELSSLTEFVHFACTSEDINNLSYGLMQKAVRENILSPGYQQILDHLYQAAKNYADMPLLARTHGQPASPTTLGKEFANVAARLKIQLATFNQLPIPGKFNGATGNFNAHLAAYPEVDWLRLSNAFISSLGLTPNNYSTQIEPHDRLAEYMQCLQRMNNILIDFSRDIWSYISIDYFSQQQKEGEIGSSTMPHKVNPIDFENAEGNFGIANALFEFFANKLPISRWQRDLTDSTVLRNLGVSFAHTHVALQSLEKGLNKLTPNSSLIKEDLDKHIEVLAEAIQTVMRRYNVENPYEKLKALTRGKKITAQALSAFIDELEIPLQERQRLKTLTPSQYTGLATKLANEVNN